MTNTTKSVATKNSDEPKPDMGYLIRITIAIGLSSM